MVLIFQAIKR